MNRKSSCGYATHFYFVNLNYRNEFHTCEGEKARNLCEKFDLNFFVAV
jgi:hypothetical protein